METSAIALRPGAVRIALVGLPGSGKSTVGRQTARRLGVDFYDLDQLIESRSGCSVRAYFERHGEAAFRELETAVVDETTQYGPCVLATGGGAVLNETSRTRLQQRTQCIYLHTLAEEIFRRLRHDKSRPLLQVADPLGRLRDMYAFRDPLYRQVAAFVVEAAHQTVPKLVDTICARLRLAEISRP